jgi:hypothetical protein
MGADLPTWVRKAAHPTRAIVTSSLRFQSKVATSVVEIIEQ